MESLIIGIAGGSGSGRSTFTNRIKKRFGDDVVVLYHDNYYRRQDGIPFEQRVTVNYDHPDSLETELLVEHLKLLRQGKAIRPEAHLRFSFCHSCSFLLFSFLIEKDTLRCAECLLQTLGLLYHNLQYSTRIF